MIEQLIELIRKYKILVSANFQKSKIPLPAEYLQNDANIKNGRFGR